VIGVSPPTAKDLLTGITDMQGTPFFGINVRYGNERSAVSRLPGMRQQPITEANIHVCCVDPEPYVQCLEGTLFRAP
jgi:hypothetical protein